MQLLSEIINRIQESEERMDMFGGNLFDAFADLLKEEKGQSDWQSTMFSVLMQFDNIYESMETSHEVPDIPLKKKLRKKKSFENCSLF